MTVESLRGGGRRKTTKTDTLKQILLDPSNEFYTGNDSRADVLCHPYLPLSRRVYPRIYLPKTHIYTLTIESMPRKACWVCPVVYWFPKGPRLDDLFRFWVTQTSRNRSVVCRQWCTVVRDSTPLHKRSVAIYCGSTRFMNRTANRFRLKQRNSGFNRVKPVRPLYVTLRPPLSAFVCWPQSKNDRNAQNVLVHYCTL